MLVLTWFVMVLVGVVLSAGDTSYIKGAIDVARCRASCTDKFLPAAVVTDSSCRSSPDCNMVSCLPLLPTVLFPGCYNCIIRINEATTYSMNYCK